MQTRWKKRASWAGLFAASLCLSFALSAAAEAQRGPAAFLQPAQYGGEETGAYQAQMIRLATILGSMHHIRPLCLSGEGQTWRDEMLTLIRLENPPRERKNRMIAAFNEAFESAKHRYPQCSGAARAESQALAQEGAALSRAIADNIVL